MGLNIRLYGINSAKPFTLSYRIGKTAGNESVIATGYTSYGSLYPASTSRNYTNDPIIFSGSTMTGVTFDTQYFFKLTYTGDTGDINYYIENIFTNEAEAYDNCINCCYFPNVGSASFVQGPTATPTLTPDSTAIPTPTPTPSPSPSPTPSSTNPGPTATATTPGATPDPTATATPGPTATATAPPPTPSPSATSLPGTCYQMIFPTSATTLNEQTLYICYQKTDDTNVCWPYTQYEDSGANSPSITVKICSKTSPTIKYGLNGEQTFPDASFNLTAGSGCTTSSDCGGNDPTPPPPTATPEVITNDSGSCYKWTVSDGNSNSGTTVTYTQLGTNVPTTTNVNMVESDTQYYYICSKTLPDFRAGGNSVTFPSMQDGTCSLVNGVFSGCQPPPPAPTATPGPTATPAPTPSPTAVPGSSCIVWSESSASGLADGCGGNQRTTTTLTVQLKDGSGNSINATETIIVSFAATYSNELGNTSTTISAQIANGYSSGVTTYSPLTYELGPYSGQCTPETTTRDGDVPTITGSNNGTYLVCPT